MAHGLTALWPVAAVACNIDTVIATEEEDALDHFLNNKAVVWVFAQETKVGSESICES